MKNPVGRPALELGEPSKMIGTRVSESFAAAVEEMCADLGKTKSELGRQLWEEKMMKHLHLKRLRARTTKGA